jgi:hypothetical protein
MLFRQREHKFAEVKWKYKIAKVANLWDKLQNEIFIKSIARHSVCGFNWI